MTKIMNNNEEMFQEIKELEQEHKKYWKEKTKQTGIDVYQVEEPNRKNALKSSDQQTK